ncbi:hypothetical protein C1645_794987 [Glomus cerebriforme]|uniref:Uncharacterized protein n=1 Tax=Glomus cerebriforme TaxID=658196 RepID=A0A397S0F9_9GLOM|nr:hypothetical protein C1645_794987 [Glomus cerebriforme]
MKLFALSINLPIPVGVGKVVSGGVAGAGVGVDGVEVGTCGNGTTIAANNTTTLTIKIIIIEFFILFFFFFIEFLKFFFFRIREF